MLIQKHQRSPLQMLLRHFVKSGEMSKSTLHIHLNYLKRIGKISLIKDGKTAYYCLPGMSLPEKEPPAEVDRFMIEEMKKIVSDIIASGLIWVDEETELATEEDPARTEGERRNADRYQLAQRAWTLYWAVRHILIRRTYRLPEPDYLGVGHIPNESVEGDRPRKLSARERWEQDEWEVVDGWTVRPSQGEADSIIEWMHYYLNAIDFLTRMLPETNNRSQRSKGQKSSPTK